MLGLVGWLVGGDLKASNLEDLAKHRPEIDFFLAG